MEFKIENLRSVFQEIEPITRLQYIDMCKTLSACGVNYPEFKPVWDMFFNSNDKNELILYTVRVNSVLVGYLFVTLHYNLLNFSLSASDNGFYVLKEYRNGIGKKLLKFVLEDLRNRRVKFLNMDALTDPRVEKLWQRMGFKSVCKSMIYQF